MNLACNRRAGFTLVEVMVALAITAIALVAGIRATSALVDNADRQGTLLLAQTCADNQLVALRLARRLPGTGASTLPCRQAGHDFALTQTVYPTPNPAFRRVEVAVARAERAGDAIVHITTIVGSN